MEPLSANDPRMIGEFRLHARLGAGGMGQVYLGFSPAGRAVAIKVIHPQFARDREFLQRFSNEVAAASAVGGMYTAPVVDCDLNSETPWLATAYVPGPTLAAFIARHGPLPEAAAWRLAAGLAEALRAVHAKGLIHRDLKPANVLLADNGPHVIDFGISRAASSMTQLTSAGMAIGTPGYMSPEQAQVQQVGPASDLFSLGCVLAYAAAGVAPFHGENPASILYLIVSAQPDLAMVPPGLRPVIGACLQKNPAARPTTGQLISMINRLGPAAAPSLGSFWPEPVARAIAAEQAAQVPSGLTPPSLLPGTGPVAAGGPAVAVPASTPAAAERTPTVLAEQAPGRLAGATGHAPMISDGYYAAAQRPPAAAPLSSGPSLPPATAAAPRAYGGRAPGGQVPPTERAPYGPPYDAAGYGPAAPGGHGGTVLRYPAGPRKPLASEVPPAVRNAVRLMWAGFAVTLVDIGVSLRAVNRFKYETDLAAQLGRAAEAAAARSMAGATTIGLLADFLGLACWAWLAAATRRGHGWPRVAGPVLFCVYTVITLIVVFGTARDTSVQFTTIAVWALGLASAAPLWTRQASEFFAQWRKP